MPKAMSNTDKAGGGKIPERMGAFERIGVPADVDESRSAAVCRRDDGAERIVIAARGYVLIVDPETGSCSQLYFPGGEGQYPFASASDPRGWFYTGAGRYFYIVDPFTPAFVGQHRIPEGEEEAGFAFAVKGDGRVYATTYPGSYLVELDASSDSSCTLCRLDSERKYAMTLACGSDGKIYAGLGTTSSAIVCFHEETGELEILLEGPRICPGALPFSRAATALSTAGCLQERMETDDGTGWASTGRSQCRRRKSVHPCIREQVTTSCIWTLTVAEHC